MKYYAALSLDAVKKKLNSCIEESSKILEMLIPRMINDSLKLTVDQIFPAPGSMA